MAKVHELHFELLLQWPYSPDLAPSDNRLFANLERMLQKRFGSSEEVILETEAYFEAKDMALLEKCWN